MKSYIETIRTLLNQIKIDEDAKNEIEMNLTLLSSEIDSTLSNYSNNISKNNNDKRNIVQQYEDSMNDLVSYINKK